MASRWLRIFLGGMAIGAADLVPGISGGSVAFLLGLYPQLIESIHSWRGRGWRFLAVLLGGAALSIISLAPFFSLWLHEPTSRTLLYASFTGLIMGSVPFCFREVKEWNTGRRLSLLVGIVLTMTVSLASMVMGPLSFSFTGIGRDLWLVFAGATAVCATLLPGISGSVVLVILGAYTGTIDSLTKIFVGELSAWRYLICLGLGIVLGAVRFVRLIRWLFNHYPQGTHAFLSGCLLGAWPALWPFWAWKQGVPISPILPSLSRDAFALLLFGTSLLVVFLLERKRQFCKE